MSEKINKNKEIEDQLLEPQPLSNKRIAKNAIMLYMRMFFTMIVGLYTSRVVLNTLGADDYGIFGVVGSALAMITFINASMSSATSRFLTFELGQQNFKKLSETFSSALIVHIIIALFVLIIAETVGLWFLCNKLVIPEDRMDAALWVYQCSIISAMLGLTQAPYNASIIAHEKMGVYAYVEILNVTLKLLIVYLLVIGNFDKLKLYSVLVLAVSTLIMLIYRIYCIRNFKETHFHWIWKKSILKPLVSFSGWDLYNNMCLTARAHGRNFLINIFFGVIYNAANGIATTATGVLSGLARNILIAFRPQIIKSYAQGSLKDMNILLLRSTKISTLFAIVICVPICLEINFILKVWLSEVPLGTAEFCVLSLISWCFIMLFSSLSIGNHATGKIKGLSFVTGSIHILNIPIVLLGFKFGLRVEFAYIVSIITNFLIVFVNLFFIKKWIISFSIINFFKKCFFPILFTTAIILGISLIIKGKLNNEMPFLQLTIYTIISVTITFLIGLNKSEKTFVRSFIRKKLHFK